MKRKFSVVFLVVIALLLVGCSDLASIQLSHDSRSILEVGEVVNLVAEGKSSMETTVRLGDVEWYVNDSALASVEGSGTNAVLTILGAGEVIVTAQADDISGSLAFTVTSDLPDPVIYTESFEDFAEGEYPQGWLVLSQEAHDAAGHSGARVTTKTASDGAKAVAITSIPGATGGAEYIFDEPLLYNRLTVDLNKDANVTENVNIELHGETGRVFGLFITASGNVRYRHPDGSNGDNITSISNGQWVTVEFEWNDTTKRYKAFVISDGSRFEVTPPGGSSYETSHIDEQVVKFSASITARDEDKTAYLDNLVVVDLAIQDMLND